MLILSDQQIITGISILLAGFASLHPSGDGNPVSIYHWQILTYLAWLSSNVHLATISVLRDWLRQRRGLFIGRIIGMAVLLALLLAALVPSVSLTWVFVLGEPSVYGIPVSCAWKLSDKAGINLNAPFSIMLLIISYLVKIAQLNDTSRYKLRKWLRSAPEWLLERLASRILRLKENRTHYRAICFHVYALVYVPFHATCEFVESFAASLWLVTIGLLWGSFQIYVPRAFADPEVRSAESVWSFGQILPLLLLFQPVIAIVEHFQGTMDTLHVGFKIE